MRLSDLQYDLPPELIAQQAIEPRDAARLLVLHRDTGRVEHRGFREITELLHAGDALVVNDTRVIPARFFLRRGTGGRVEALFLHEQPGGWRIMLKGSGRLKVGETLHCEEFPAHCLVLAERLERGDWLARPVPPIPPLELLARIGQTPLPPYIHRAAPDAADVARYQTVYADRPGAVAAPTAGMHFTPELLERLAATGVRRAGVTLHVGAGTFVPVQTEVLANHRMHAEWYEIGAAAADVLRDTRGAGGRVVAVGTTSARVLESLPDIDSPEFGPASGWTEIFLYPPYRFRNVDVLLTNFHLPGSTLLALVMAFATPEQIRAAYREAIAQRYRFYSYGDAMLIV